jgi:hypothetical protein
LFLWRPEWTCAAVDAAGRCRGSKEEEEEVQEEDRPRKPEKVETAAPSAPAWDGHRCYRSCEAMGLLRFVGEWGVGHTHEDLQFFFHFKSTTFAFFKNRSGSNLKCLID